MPCYAVLVGTLFIVYKHHETSAGWVIYYNSMTPNCDTIEISFGLDFLRFFERKKAFYEKFKNDEKHQLKINVCAFIYLVLVGHNLQNLLSPFRNRKFSPMSHTSGFDVKVKKSLSVILFFKVIPMTSSNDAESLKISLPLGR